MSSFGKVVLRAGVIAGLALSASQAYATCTFGGSGEPSLQGVFNGLFTADAPSVTACIDEGQDAAWTPVGQAAFIEIGIELAGNASSNTFGIYDFVTGSQIRIFEGNDGAGTLGVIQVSQRTNGTWRARVMDTNNTSGEGTGFGSWVSISSPVLGFYLGTAANGTFYSDTTRNADGVDHMYAYGPLLGEFEGQYVVAWEDLLNGGDGDYQDFVATLTDLTPVPLPTALWLLASGLIGLAGVARRHS